jgi:hypothetical protein
MLRKTLTIIALGLSVLAYTQQAHKFSIGVNYGLQGNFFVRSYDEYAPGGVKRFLNKNFVGTIGGVELKYNTSEHASLNLAYSQSVNKREINFNNGSGDIVSHFNIRHINNFFQLSYETIVSKNAKWFRVNAGVYYLRSRQQEIDASQRDLSIEERDYKSNGLEEGGVFLGLNLTKKIDTKLDLGLRSNIYFTVSTGAFEAVTLTPTLTYHL